MPLPDLIEIVPLMKPVQAEITVPGSKSITNRALILAALAQGETTLQGALWSEDTQVMVECLRKLGFAVDVAADPDEFCNRTITVQGMGGRIPNSGAGAKPLELFVGNAGTAARFLAALVCLGRGAYRLNGVSRMHERPQAALFKALWDLGYRIDSPNDKLPATIHGTGPMEGKCHVGIDESSQFASALLLCAAAGRWEVEVVGYDPEESPYVVMTLKLIEAFSKCQGNFQIEPDASSGSYFWAAQYFNPRLEISEFSEPVAFPLAAEYFKEIKVAHWPTSGWQVDQEFPEALSSKLALHAGFLGKENPLSALDPVEVRRMLKLPPISRRRDLGDSIMTAIVMAPFAATSILFTDLGRLRVQECERVIALRTELTKCGAKILESGDSLEVFPSEMQGAQVETYNDHRMAMCFAILGLKIPGMKIKNPACVKKTFPNFFQKLAATPPGGLGATIIDPHTGRRLGESELFAD